MAEYDTSKPVEDDVRHDDLEFNPALEPKSSRAWLNLLEESEKAFEDWNDHCDKIDKQYANLERLSGLAKDREFQMFWANAEVIKPAIYAKPPVPVVVPKFKDRRPVYQQASELMERCAIVAFDLAHINDLMLQIRDDLALIGRGVAWCRYESGKGASKSKGQYDHEKVCIDFKHRKDFLHSISRCWYEVTWVAAASYLTRDEARKRFKEYSGDAYQDAEYRVDKDSKEVGGADARERAKFWEIWHKPSRRVLWVAKGCDDILDEADPHLDLCNFFPCPKPAYGTLQRGSLVPVPDVLQYKDQLEELNMLTNRIHHLSEAVEAKGFYPAGGAELSDAIQAAIKTHTPGRLLVPVANWAAFGGTKEVIIWLPIDMIAQTVTALVMMRKQIIEDIYQIMGLSDIMRGATDPNETLGAQQLKTQYGSTRIRDKQQELVRIARDLVEITAEIIVEKFDPVTLIEMSQTQLPTQQMQEAQAQEIQQQMQNQQMAMEKMQMMAQSDPKMQQMVQQKPEVAQQLIQKGQEMLQSGQDSIKKIMDEPNLEQVLYFLKSNRIRTFVLDIETDSTIMVDENAEKQRTTEFMQVLGGTLQQLSALVGAKPKAAKFAGDVLKFATRPFRAGRQLEASIDELVELMESEADNPRPDDPTTAAIKGQKEIEQIKQDRQREKDKADVDLKRQELQMRDQHEKMKIESNERIKAAELAGKSQDDESRAQLTNLKAMNDREKHAATMREKDANMGMLAQKAALAAQTAQQRSSDMAQRGQERRAAAQFKQTQGGFTP